MGHSDPGFIPVEHPPDPELAMYGGLQKMKPAGEKIVTDLTLRAAGPAALADNSDPILSWIAEKEIKQLAIPWIWMCSIEICSGRCRPQSLARRLSVRHRER